MSVLRNLFVGLYCFSPSVFAGENPQQECLIDLKALPEFIKNNDAGGKDIFQEKGELYFSTALQQSEQKIAAVTTEKECLQLLRGYLKVWRKGHLDVEPFATAQIDTQTSSSAKSSSASANAVSKTDSKPKIQFISAKTLVLSLPDFSPENRKPLIELLDQQRKTLERTPNWIIDVRGNGGGSDSSYTPLLPWVLVNETHNIGSSWLVTPDNINGQRTLCAKYAPGNKDCIKSLEKAARRMEGQPAGSFVPQYDGDLIKYVSAEKHFHPEKVALVIDKGCASSCEELVLKLRQSFNVKIIGTRTYGALDYSNLRAYSLPSGKRELWYATSRSNRLPHIKIDGNGIMADIYFPVPEDKNGKDGYISRIQHWIEGGSLAAD
jgi:hypothetical protein